MKEPLRFQSPKRPLAIQGFILRARRRGLLKSEKEEKNLKFVLEGWRESGEKDLRFLAAILLVVRFKAKNFNIYEDKGKKRKIFNPYFRRGYLPIRGESNYRLLSRLSGVDLIKHPNLLSNPRVARLVLYVILLTELKKFFTHDKTDWVGFIKYYHLPDWSINIILKTFYYDLRKTTNEK